MKNPQFVNNLNKLRTFFRKISLTTCQNISYFNAMRYLFLKLKGAADNRHSGAARRRLNP